MMYLFYWKDGEIEFSTSADGVSWTKAGTVKLPNGDKFLAQLSAGGGDALAETLGIRLRSLDSVKGGSAQAARPRIDTAHPLLAGNSWNAPAASLEPERLKEVEGISVIVDDPRAATLGIYPNSGRPAAAAVAGDGKGKMIFIGAYTLSRDAISRLAAYAGAWRVTPPGNAIAADTEILMVHPLKDGNVEVVLKEAAALNEVEPGSLTSSKALTHSLELQAGHTYLFKQQPEPPVLVPVPSAAPEAAAAPKDAEQKAILQSELPPVLGCDWGPIQIPLDQMNLPLLKKAELDTVIVGMNVGWHGSLRRAWGKKSSHPVNRKTFWNGKNSYDPESVRELLDLASQQHPQAKIILWLQIDTYPEWISENPGEALRNNQGEGFVVGFHYKRAGNEPDATKGEVLAWSFYSQKLREDLRPMLRDFIKTVESAKGGDQVVGYLIGGAQDAQFFLWEPPNGVKAADANAWSDYSEPAVRAWQQWLQKKYHSTAALSEVWKQDVASFAAVTPPAAVSLIGTERFHDPETEVRQRDWKEFIAD
ncbi:MAG: hypothetical protein WCP55_23055, partial [Lentisphaerota bacterium]